MFRVKRNFLIDDANSPPFPEQQLSPSKHSAADSKDDFGFKDGELKLGKVSQKPKVLFWWLLYSYCFFL